MLTQIARRVDGFIYPLPLSAAARVSPYERRACVFPTPERDRRNNVSACFARMTTTVAGGNESETSSRYVRCGHGRRDRTDVRGRRNARLNCIYFFPVGPGSDRIRVARRSIINVSTDGHARTSESIHTNGGTETGRRTRKRWAGDELRKQLSSTEPGQ